MMNRNIAGSFILLLAVLLLTTSMIHATSYRMEQDDESNELRDERGISSPFGFFEDILLDTGIRQFAERRKEENQKLRVAQRSLHSDPSASSGDADDFNQRDYDFSRLLRKKRQALRAH